MGKTLNLKNMYRDLRYGAVVNCNGCRIHRAESSHKRNGRTVELLFWYHFGASAEPCTMKDLRFICSVIAESKDYEYSIVCWQM